MLLQNVHTEPSKRNKSLTNILLVLHYATLISDAVQWWCDLWSSCMTRTNSWAKVHASCPEWCAGLLWLFFCTSFHMLSWITQHSNCGLSVWNTFDNVPFCTLLYMYYTEGWCFLCASAEVVHRLSAWTPSVWVCCYEWVCDAMCVFNGRGLVLYFERIYLYHNRFSVLVTKALCPPAYAEQSKMAMPLRASCPASLCSRHISFHLATVTMVRCLWFWPLPPVRFRRTGEPTVPVQEFNPITCTICSRQLPRQGPGLNAVHANLKFDAVHAATGLATRTVQFAVYEHVIFCACCCIWCCRVLQNKALLVIFALVILTVIAVGIYLSVRRN